VVSRRLLAVALGLAVIALISVQVASADPPTRSPAPSPPVSGRFCPGFGVLVNPVINSEYAITFSNGATTVTGRFVVDLTANGKTIQVNASGPVFFSPDGSTVTLRGNTLVFGAAGDFGPGSPPTLRLVSGVVVVTVGSGGVTGLSVTGNNTDLCSLLT
jgi:hypothetical protein